MREVYRGLAVLIALAVLAQAAGIAYAWSAVLGDLEGGAVLTHHFDRNAGHVAHRVVGMVVIPLASLLLLAVSPFTRAQGASWRAALVVLTVVVQVVLALVSSDAAAVGALHGGNALVVLGATLHAARSTTRPAAAAPAVPVRLPVQAGGPAVDDPRLRRRPPRPRSPI